MKKIILFLLLIANMAIFAYGAAEEPDTTQVVAVVVEEEVVVDAEPAPECMAGGKGSPSCTVPAGQEFNGGITGGCSVTCMEGYYACCGIQCHCKPNEK